MITRRIAAAALCAQLLCIGSAQVIITEEPQGQVAAPGSTVRFRVSATSQTRLFYQWKFNGQDLPGGTNRDLSFRATPTRSGIYAAHIRDAFTEAVTTPAELQVLPRPRVLVQPVNMVVGVGGTTAFTVVMNQSGPYSTFVWHNSNRLEGSHVIPDGLGADVHSPRLVIAECADNPIYEGLYWISATNEVGGTVSRRARLTVVGPPQLVENPRDVTIATGRTARFRVAWALDQAPWKACQWFKDDMAIPGATTRVLLIDRAQKENAGWYRCSVRSIGGTTDSSMAQLRILD